MELENAIKSIFVQCLNEPDIMETIKNKLNYSSHTRACEEKQPQRPHDCLNENNNVISSVIIEKVNEILEIQKRIEDWIGTGNKKEADREDKISAELKNCQEQIDSLIIENESLKKENDKLKTENKDLEEKCSMEISKYAVFEEPLEVWNCINTLNDDNREYIGRLCGSFNILALLSLGRDDGKIEQLWFYLRDMSVKGVMDKIEVSKLNRYFEFCLKVANSTKPENERYIVSDIEPESEFNMGICIRTADSRQIGKIKDIIVRSVRVGENIKYKAVVSVE